MGTALTSSRLIIVDFLPKQQRTWKLALKRQINESR